MQKIFTGYNNEINNELANGWNYSGVIRVTSDQQKLVVVLEKNGNLSSEITSNILQKNDIEQPHEFKAGDIVRIIHLPPGGYWNT